MPRSRRCLHVAALNSPLLPLFHPDTLKIAYHCCYYGRSYHHFHLILLHLVACWENSRFPQSLKAKVLNQMN
ncbi:hypothetical protein MtrunA17_Chr3g0103401 [Medicago truncatula]|uniref:Uncharacterized protein n=1 Tax=Medicago truncatula TaxID=3880 RepID=A0A396ISN3_MEDTR|nr:hypothetical protein MtrunA17_Chr3g0103401 [Medicago truncatula]